MSVNIIVENTAKKICSTIESERLGMLENAALPVVEGIVEEAIRTALAEKSLQLKGILKSVADKEMAKGQISKAQKPYRKGKIFGLQKAAGMMQSYLHK